MSQYFAQAIGACLAAQNEGLVAAFLPDGIGDETARALARRANRVRNGETNYAIVVNGGALFETPSEIDVVETDEKGATKYRQGNRLVVFVGQQAGIHSVTETLRTGLSRSFPEDEFRPLTLEAIATAALDIIFETTGTGTRSQQNQIGDVPVKRLAGVFSLLKDAHRSLGSASRPWNAQWFEHCSVGLDRLADALSRADDGDEVSDVLDRFTYAAFALPHPDDGLAFASTRTRATALSSAITTWWSDSATIESTCSLIAANPHCNSEAQLVNEADWSAFDRTLVLCEGNALLALVRDEASASVRMRSFASLSERDFFDPVPVESAASLEILAEGGGSLLVDESLSGVSVLDGTQVVGLGGKYGVETPPVKIVVPLLAIVTPEELESSRFRLSVAPSSCGFDMLACEVNGAKILVTGRFVQNGLGASFSFTPKKHRVGVSLDAKDPLVGKVDPRAGASFIVLPPAGAGAFLIPSKRGRWGSPTWVGSTRFDADRRSVASDDRVEFVVPVEPKTRQRILMCTDHAGEPSVNGKPARAVADRAGIWVADLDPSGNDTIAVGLVSIEVQVDASGHLPKSPVVAAVLKVAPSAEEPSPRVRSSLRGKVEHVLASSILDSTWSPSLGHLALSVDEPADLDALTAIADGSIVTAEAMAERWQTLGMGEVPEPFLRSNAVTTFVEAFDALRLSERLLRDEGEAGTARRWPSQTSWAHLFENTENLDRYLDAYSRLVEAGRASGSDFAAFWATYPFCVSAWKTGVGAAELQAVLLSPLHPVRLAWLASTEHTLRNSELAQNLCGSVEGWNMPIVGPAERRQGRLVAVPIDNGEEQLFLGWSMLVRARTDTSLPLVGPEFVGGHPAPGSSASGLNAGGVAAAIRDYRRLNPHVSTLTVDLAAATPAPRLDEIDDAVLGEVVSWASDATDALPGGVRVFDSTNRRGAAPRDHVRELVGPKLAVPISWMRYRPDDERPIVANIRILQDAGVAIRADLDARPGFGVIGARPLRRFEAPELVHHSHSAESSPALAHSGTWKAFAGALAAAEQSTNHGAGTSIESSLYGSALTTGNAQWIISGESMVTPAALASLLAHQADSDTMLWEWRPPFLNVESDNAWTGQLERRPYVSVVRIPKALETRLDARLDELSSNDRPAKTSLEILRVLGARGIGLSSLVSMGDNHESGALGFYSVLQLMSGALTAEVDQIVLPIDVCDNFLNALAGEASVGLQRRADLLVAQIRDDSVTLIPIEIKFYAATEGFPEPAGRQVSDPLEQLSATHRTLEAIAARWAGSASNSGSASHQLLANGLGALVEAGMRLSPHSTVNRERAVRRLGAIVGGSAAVSVGRPVLAYFAGGRDGLPSFETHSNVVDPIPERCGVHGEFFCDPRILFDETTSPGAAEAWRNLLSWAGTLDIDSAQPPEKDAEAGDAAVDREHIASPEPERNATTREVPAADGGVGEPRIGDGGPNAAGEGVRFSVGQLLGSVRQANAEFWPSNTQLNQLNVGVVGDLGTGKTQLLKALISNLRSGTKERQPNPLSILVFDYKTDFQNEEFLDRVGGRLLRPVGIPLNIFGIDGEYEPRLGFERARAFVDVLSRIYSGIGPVQSDRLVNTILSLYEEFGPAGPLIDDVLAAYRNAAPAADSVVSVLNAFVLGQVFSTRRDELVPFGDLLHDTVLVLDLAGLGADQQAKNALVAFFLNQYYEYMQGLTKWPYEGTEPQLRRLNSFLLVDEAVNIMQYKFDVLSQLMLQGREYGVGVILASQYLSHFQQSGVNYGEPLRTWFIHRVPQVTVRDLARLGLPEASADDAAMISSLGVHEAYYSSLGYPGRRIRGTPYFELAQGVEG